MKKTKLSKPYISIGNSFGGSQEWFKSDSGWKEKAIRGYGCGLIGAADVIYFITNSIKGMEKSGNINFDSYMDYVRKLEKKYFRIYPKLGISGILLSLWMNLYFFFHRKEIKEKTGHRFTARWAVLPWNILKRIKEMLNSDIPVIISIGPGFFRKARLSFYSRTVDKDGRVTYTPVTETKDHYVTVTGVIEEKKDVHLEISSWGRKYYISYKEYVDYVKRNDNFFFSNILFIKKHLK